MTELVERPMTRADVSACLEVFFSSINELFARWNQPSLPPDEGDGLASFFADLAFGEGGRAWVAAKPDGRPAGFGIAIEREATWFLSFLFVEPGIQTAGVGRGILRRLVPGPGSPAAAPGALHHTCIDALQPISAGLYATFGLLPRVPIYEVLGRPRPGALAPLPDGVVAVPFHARPGHTKMTASEPVDPASLPTYLLAELDATDRRVLGWRRRHDHLGFMADGRLLVRYRGRDGGPLGYGYVHASGRAGPIAVRDAALLPAVTGDLLGRLEPGGAWRVYVPGHSTSLVPLIEGGMRINGNPALWSGNREGPAWDGYLPASFGLL